MVNNITPRMQQEEPSTDLVKKVFVYGTLKSGGEIRGLDMYGNHSSIVGKAKTKYPDYEMISLGAFPGVLTGGDKHIQGEVWEVSQALADEIDDIEGYPSFYNKVMVDTTLGRAEMYFLDRNAYKKYIGQTDDQLVLDGNTYIWKNNGK